MLKSLSLLLLLAAAGCATAPPRPTIEAILRTCQAQHPGDQDAQRPCIRDLLARGSAPGSFEADTLVGAILQAILYAP